MHLQDVARGGGREEDAEVFPSGCTQDGQYSGHFTTALSGAAVGVPVLEAGYQQGIQEDVHHACRVPCRSLVPTSHRGRQVWGSVIFPLEAYAQVPDVEEKLDALMQELARCCEDTPSPKGVNWMPRDHACAGQVQ